MKHLLLTTIAAVLVVGCGPSASKDIYQATTLGDIYWVEKHLDTGADVNAKNVSGWTPLQVAAVGGHEKVVELLISKGAKVNMKKRFNKGDGAPEFVGKILTALDLSEAIFSWDNSETIANKKETAALLRKHGGKTGEELKAEGK